LKVIILNHPDIRTEENYQTVANAPLAQSMMPGYLASVLRENGHTIEYIDADLKGWNLGDTLNWLSNSEFDLLSLHLVYSFWKTDSIFNLLRDLREGRDDFHLNLFGYYPGFHYNSILRRYPFIDSITLGEPEYTVLELVNSLEARDDWRTVRGLVFYNRSAGSEIVKTDSRPLIKDIDILPFPIREMDGLYHNSNGITYILGSRGCYSNCTFCYINPFYGDYSIWRGRSPENIVEEMEYLYRRYSERYFYFADPNFFGPSRALRLASLIRERCPWIRFGIECRANDIREESLKSLVHSGLREVFLGVESGSYQTLKKFRKGLTPDENRAAINLLRRYGVDISIGYIMFEPESDLTDVREGFDFLKDMNLLSSPSVTAHLLYHSVIVYRGVPLSKKIDSINSDDYEIKYNISDTRVGILQDHITDICQRTMDICKGGDLCKDYKSNDKFKILNSILIDSFEDILSILEKGN